MENFEEVQKRPKPKNALWRFRKAVGRNVYRIFKKIMGENVDKETVQCYTVAMETGRRG
jgi:hypothetical protein